MSKRKCESGDIAMIDQGDGTVHAYQAIELADGTYAWRDLGIMQFEDNKITSIEWNAK